MGAKYKSYSDWSKRAHAGEIYSGDDSVTMVKLVNPDKELEKFEVQIYADGYCHFYYGVDYHGEALYHINGEWLPYEEIPDSPFPDFVEKTRQKVKSRK